VYLGQVQTRQGVLVNPPLSVDSVPFPNWRTLPPDLNARTVRDAVGRQVQVSSFMGGWLIDGCPLNVVYGEGWVAGQQEALKAAGMVNCLPEPPQIQQQYPIIPGGPQQPPGTQFVPTGTLPRPTVQTPPILPPIITGGPYEPPIISEPEPGAAPSMESMLPYILIGGAVLFFAMSRKGR
jgi:hypothetical protein